MGTVPTLLVQAPTDRGHAWLVSAGLARLPGRVGYWSPAGATLADAVSWMLAGRIVPHTPRPGSRVTNRDEPYEWAEGWTSSWNDSWGVWWTAPSHVAAKGRARPGGG